MQLHRWFNQSHPRNLQNAAILLYFNAAFALLFGVLAGGVGGQISIIDLAGAAGAYGMANDKKWGYYVSVVVAILPFLFYGLAILHGDRIGFSLNMIFELILLLLLFQKDVREYIRIWFR
jgi:hypothetical protein